MKRGLAICLVVLGVSGTLLAQDMAEAARKERERRKKAEAAGQAQVVTGDDLQNGKGRLANDPGAAQASPSPPPASAKTAGARSSSAIPDSMTDRRAAEEQWRARATALRGEVEIWQKRYDLWSSQYLAPGDYFVDDQGHKLVGSPENLQKLIARAKVRLDTAKKQLEDFETDARRQSIPPGWLR